jgi:ribonuclease H2 subunit A
MPANTRCCRKCCSYVFLQVFVDTVGDAGKYEARLSRDIPGVKFTVCPKADSIYPIVSAASIAAKVTRDQMQANIQGESGSGYPGDAVTKAWLADRLDPVFGFPPDVRCGNAGLRVHYVEG